jgi:hypothetical protein
MSIETAALGLAADAATGGWRVYAKVALKLAPYLVIGGLIIALLITRATLADARFAAQLAVANAKTREETLKAGFALQGKNAAETYADKLQQQAPIVLRATDTVREYANTAAGRAICADADRVRATDVLDQQLFPAGTP